MMNDDNSVAKKGFKENVTLIGFVSEYWLIDGSKGLVIITDDGDEFYVIPNKLGKKLKSFLGMEMVVSGFVTMDEARDSYISIQSFEVMDDDDDEFESDYDHDVY